VEVVPVPPLMALVSRLAVLDDMTLDDMVGR